MGIFKSPTLGSNSISLNGLFLQRKLFMSWAPVTFVKEPDIRSTGHFYFYLNSIIFFKIFILINLWKAMNRKIKSFQKLSKYEGLTCYIKKEIVSLFYFACSFFDPCLSVMKLKKTKYM